MKQNIVISNMNGLKLPTKKKIFKLAHKHFIIWFKQESSSGC